MARTEQRRHTDFLGWAHFQLAVARARQAKSLQEKQVRTLIFVDADIIIGLGDPKHQREMFQDLLVHDLPAHVPASLNAFVSDWHASNVARDPTELPLWAVAEEHYAEVVHKARTLLDELDSGVDQITAAPSHEIDAGTMRRLRDVLEHLGNDPWCNIDRDLVHLLETLGVSAEEPSQWNRISSLREMLLTLGSHGRVAKGREAAGLLANIAWPRLDTPRGDDVLRAWREHLKNARQEVGGDRAEDSTSKFRVPNSRSIDNDARVLATLTLLNQDWRETKIRVELLTGSRYVMRAVATRALDPTVKASELRPELMEPMSEFLLEPSCIVSDPKLWLPLDRERSSNADTMPEWSVQAIEEKGMVTERALYFQVIHGAADPAREQWINVVPEFKELIGVESQRRSETSFRGFFTRKLSRSIALEQVQSKLTAERNRQAHAAHDAVAGAADVGELQAHLGELSRVRRAQIRIDMLEYLIHDHHVAQTAGSSTSSDVNPFRRPPFVNYSEYEDAYHLYEVLSDLEPGDKLSAANARHIADLKRKVYKADETTYMLVLVYAHVYAHQARWKLAISAADYAFLLTQTKEYKERGDKILGDESRLLKLACMRRGASNMEDLDLALLALNAFAPSVPTIASQEPLLSMRLDIERTSLELTRLFMEFHAPAGLRDEKAFRARAGDNLQRIARLWSELGELKHDHSQSDADDPAWNEMTLRLAANGCNAALLAVGWLPAVAKNSQVLQPRRHRLDARYEASVTRFVDEAMNLVASRFMANADTWEDEPHQDLLTLIAARLVLSPKLEPWQDGKFRERLREVLAAWSNLPCAHPYDADRVEYADRLVHCIRP